MTISTPTPPAGPAFPKRFYKLATTAPAPTGVALMLDGKPARTPARAPLVVPSAAVADALAAEWNAVEVVIDPRRMPFTRLINSVVDGVERTRDAVMAEVRRYAESDLLLYRAPGPADLVAAQGAAWDPILAWARESLGVPLRTGTGVMFVAQPADALDGVGRALAAQVGDGSKAPFRLGALHVMTTLTGSALLAMAVAAGRLGDDAAWAAAHVDEDHQIAAWGADEEAAARREHRWIEMRTAARLDRLLREK